VAIWNYSSAEWEVILVMVRSQCRLANYAIDLDDDMAAAERHLAIANEWAAKLENDASDKTIAWREATPVSRHSIATKDAAFEVAVGWDNALSTYFAIVERRTDNADDDDDPVILWLGCKPRECPRAEDMVAPLKPFAELSAEMIATLRDDGAATLDRGPTPFQRRQVNWLVGRWTWSGENGCGSFAPLAGAYGKGGKPNAQEQG
jgi:hypothetical protein